MVKNLCVFDCDDDDGDVVDTTDVADAADIFDASDVADDADVTNVADAADVASDVQFKCCCRSLCILLTIRKLYF